MRVKCPACQMVTELQLPILLAVCACGVLVKGSYDASEKPAQGVPTAADVNHYAILGVPKTATEADIKAAYRRKAKETHPDIGGDEEEFRLIQAAYEVLSNSMLRRKYDAEASVGHVKTTGLVTPDFIGMKVVDAVRLATSKNVAARVAIVEVGDQSQLRGRVVGQMPYSGVVSTAGIVGLLVAVPKASTLWQRFRSAATELATGFWVGLKSSTVGSGSRPAELGPATGLHSAGSVAGEVVGTVAVGAIGLAIGAISLIVRIYIGFGLLVMIGFSVILTAVAPPIGIIFGAFTAWVIYKVFQKLKKKN